MIAQIIGFTRHFLKEWNIITTEVEPCEFKNPCLVKDSGRARQSGEKWGLAVLLLSLVSCSGETTPPEEQIRKLNSDAVVAVEAKDAAALKDLIIDGYKDEHGYDKSALVRLAQLYMLGHKAIYIYTLTKSLQIVDADNAVAEVIVAMAGQPVKTADQLFDIRADLVRFIVVYVRQDSEWKVDNIQWQRATVDDFL